MNFIQNFIPNFILKAAELDFLDCSGESFSPEWAGFKASTRHEQL